MLLGETLHQLDAFVGILHGVKAMADPLHADVLRLHVGDELPRGQLITKSVQEVFRGAIDGAAEARPDGKDSADEGTDQILARACRHNRVVSARHGGSVIRDDLDDHFHELPRIHGDVLLEPQQAKNTADSVPLLDDIVDRNAAVVVNLTGFIADRRDEVGGLADETFGLGLLVVHRNVRRLEFLGRNDRPGRYELVVGCLDLFGVIVKRIGNDDAGFAKGLVLGVRCLVRTPGLGSGVAELHLPGQHLGAGAGCPHHERLGEPAVLDRRRDLMLGRTADFTEADKHLDGRVLLIAQKVVEQAGAGVGIAADGDPLVHAVGGPGNDVVRLIGHAAGDGDEPHRAGTVQLGHLDVVHRSGGVPDLEGARLDAADGRRTDDPLVFRLGGLAQDSCVSLRHTLGDHGDRSNRVGLQRLHRAFERRAL